MTHLSTLHKRLARLNRAVRSAQAERDAALLEHAKKEELALKRAHRDRQRKLKRVMSGRRVRS